MKSLVKITVSAVTAFVAGAALSVPAAVAGGPFCQGHCQSGGYGYNQGYYNQGYSYGSKFQDPQYGTYELFLKHPQLVQQYPDLFKTLDGKFGKAVAPVGGVVTGGTPAVVGGAAAAPVAGGAVAGGAPVAGGAAQAVAGGVAPGVAGGAVAAPAGGAAAGPAAPGGAAPVPGPAAAGAAPGAPAAPAGAPGTPAPAGVPAAPEAPISAASAAPVAEPVPPIVPPADSQLADTGSVE